MFYVTTLFFLEIFHSKLLGSNSLTKCIHLMFYVTTLFFFLEIFHSKLLGVKASYVTPCIQSHFITYIVYYAMQVTNF